MWIRFTEDTEIKWSPRVVQEFKEGQVRNLPHVEAQAQIDAGKAARTIKPKTDKVDDQPAEGEAPEEVEETSEDVTDEPEASDGD